MPASSFTVQPISTWFLRPLCAMAIALIIAVPAIAAEADFGVGYAQSSTADPMGGTMSFSIWYPTRAPNGVVTLGPFVFAGTRNAEPATGRFGLVVLSHGTGGSDLGHRDTAAALARAGIIAVAPLHPRDSFRDPGGGGRRNVWEGRPRQISAIIDALLERPKWSARIDEKRIGAFGFSFGGYTVLAVLGARPDFSRMISHCRRHHDVDPFCGFGRPADPGEREARAKAFAAPVQDLRDPRFCAAVIADPVAVVFPERTLKRMRPTRLLFYRPETENVLKARFHVGRVINILKGRGDFPEPREILVAKANHYSFIAPFPEMVARSFPEIASDPEGFDRAAFHEAMNKTVVMFFEQALEDCADRL